jgi:hypothetical protein
MKENINLSIQPHDCNSYFPLLIIQMIKCPVPHMEVLKGSLNPMVPEVSAHCILQNIRI